VAGSVAELVVRITSDVASAVKGMGQVESQSSKMQNGIKKAALPAAAALAGIGVAAVAAGRAAADDAQSQAILANNLDKAAGATKAQVQATEDHIAAMALATGVADDKLRPAMSNLVLATKDVATAQDALGVALDVSAATGKDVETVSAAMAKAYAGNTGSLARLVPSLDKATLASGDMNAIMGELASTTGGAAAAAAGTAAGQMQIMQVQMDEAQESIGTALLPALSALAVLLTQVAQFVQQHSTATKVLVGIVAALAAAILVANAVIKVNAIVTNLAAIAQSSAASKGLLYRAALLVQAAASGIAAVAARALGIAIAFATGPIGIAIAVIALLVAGIVLLYRNSETARNIIDGVWKAISGFVTTAVSKILGVLRNLPGQIQGVFTGAASMLTDIGRSIVEGLGAGIEAAKAWLMGKVNAIADSIPGWLKKRLGIASPSKVTAKIGKQVAQGLAKGMDDGVAGVKAVADDLAAAVTEAMEARFKSDKRAARESRQVMAAVDDETQALIRNARKRQQVYKDLAQARDDLASAVDVRDKYAASITASARAFGAITNLADKEATSAEAILADMRARVEQTGKFQQLLATLTAAGLSQANIKALADAGVEAGSAIAQGLADGGPAAIAEANALQAQLDATAAALGTDTAATMYQAGVDSAQALVDGLVLDQERLDAYAEELAKRLAKAIRKALRKALRGGGGGGAGQDASTLAFIPRTTSSSVAPMVPAGRGTRAAPAQVNHITVQGAVDPEATARQIRRILAGHDRRVGLAS
jgi:hypothetical protein